MRALQMDPLHGNPQPWAQDCFYMVTYALIGQTVLAVGVPIVLNGTVEKGDVEGDMKVTVPYKWLGMVLDGMRWLIMVGIYVCGAAVVCSLFTLKHPDPTQETPPVSPTMQCVINLAFQYFVIYLFVWIFHTVKHFSGYKGLDTIADAVESAKATVQFAPMLSVLFIATRMRALQITNNKGAPQGYVQDGMYLASWSVVIQFLMCLIMPFFTGEKFEVRSLAGTTPDDRPIKKDAITNSYGAWAVCAIRYLAVAALLGGTAAVVTGVFLMTPENANGSGSIPVVGEYIEPAPMATDIPGMESAMKATGEGIGAGADVVHGAGEATTDTVASAGSAVTER